MKKNAINRGGVTSPEFEWAALSEADPNGSHNEDCVIGDPDNGVFLVADGMGGRPGGALASKIGAETFMESLQAVSANGRLETSALQNAVKTANEAIRKRGAEDRFLKGMGTTLSALILIGNTGRIVHVGDSRVYLLRDRRLQKLTQDHTLIDELIRRNHVTRSDAEKHPFRHVLARSLGERDTVDADILNIAPQPGDWFLLATDGLTGVVSPAEMVDVIDEHGNRGVAYVCSTLVGLAVKKGPEDDVSLLVIKLNSNATVEEFK